MGCQSECGIQPIPIVKADRLPELSEIFDQSHHPAPLVDLHHESVGPLRLLANGGIVVNEDVRLIWREERQPEHLAVDACPIEDLLSGNSDRGR